MSNTTCDRCGRRPDADMLRYAASQRGEEVLAVSLCPECGYGLNTLLRAYVANRAVAVGSA